MEVEGINGKGNLYDTDNANFLQSDELSSGLLLLVPTMVTSFLCLKPDPEYQRVVLCWIIHQLEGYSQTTQT